MLIIIFIIINIKQINLKIYINKYFICLFLCAIKPILSKFSIYRSKYLTFKTERKQIFANYLFTAKAGK